MTSTELGAFCVPLTRIQEPTKIRYFLGNQLCDMADIVVGADGQPSGQYAHDDRVYVSIELLDEAVCARLQRFLLMAVAERVRAKLVDHLSRDVLALQPRMIYVRDTDGDVEGIPADQWEF